ncbi:hypothetical protein KUCAC02_033714, partial [Chaenocephalus aceratus]
ALHSSPAWSLAKGGPNTTNMETPSTPGSVWSSPSSPGPPHCSVQNRPHTHWMRYITEGYKVCVACEPPAMKNDTGRCQGDGLQDDKEVLLHWQAVGNQRLQRDLEEDPENPAVFVFI